MSNDAFKMRSLYSTSMPIRAEDDDEQSYSDRVRQYDNLINQNNLTVQQTLGEMWAEIIAIKSALGG